MLAVGHQDSLSEWCVCGLTAVIYRTTTVGVGHRVRFQRWWVLTVGRQASISEGCVDSPPSLSDGRGCQQVGVRVRW